MMHSEALLLKSLLKIERARIEEGSEYPSLKLYMHVYLPQLGDII